MANTSIPKSLYRVYECEADCFDYDPAAILIETDNLGEADTFAWHHWLADKSKSYTVIQPYDDSCRGHYGIKSYNYGDEE
jgi:hypothetical protein